MVGAAVLYVLMGGWALGAFLAHILSLFVLNRFCPWKKLVITAEFNGISFPKKRAKKHLRPKTTSTSSTSSSTSSTVGKAHSSQIQDHGSQTPF